MEKPDRTTLTDRLNGVYTSGPVTVNYRERGHFIPAINQEAAEVITELRHEIIQAMKDICHADGDTYWIGPAETAFERLAAIYMVAGGKTEDLKAIWPQYF